MTADYASFEVLWDGLKFTIIIEHDDESPSMYHMDDSEVVLDFLATKMEEILT